MQACSGWYERAILEYLRAIELDQNSDDAYRRLGEAYEDNNQLDEALTAFRTAVKTGPQQYRNFRDLGSFFYERASYQEAIVYFRRAVELAPNEPQHSFTALASLISRPANSPPPKLSSALPSRSLKPQAPYTPWALL